MTYDHETEKTMIANAVEEMRPQIEGPARPEVDYTLTANDIRLVGEWVASYRGGKIAETCELWNKFNRAFETIIRDVQP